MNRIFALLAAVSLVISTPAFADDVPAPIGEVILAISGQISATNVGDELHLDRDALMAIGMRTIETTTIWTEGVQVFEGVPLVALMQLLNVEEGRLLATAINDYTIEIPVSDAIDGGPMIAVMLNSEQMSIRDKGPLWMIYPYDQSAAYRSEVIYSRSIWQLDRIEVIR
ncbi:MAG: hypothetical protein AB8B54_01350 [Sphingorhabdus sp.]